MTTITIMDMNMGITITTTTEMYRVFGKVQSNDNEPSE
jgi:hypothetical protein